MEDYTYDLAAKPAADPRRAHARGLPVDRLGQAIVRDPPAVDRRRGGSGSAGFRRRHRPRDRRRAARPRRPLPLAGERDRGRRAAAAAAEATGRARALAAEARLCDRVRGVACRGRPPPHGLHERARYRSDRRLREIAGVELLRDRRATRRCATSATSCAGIRRITAWRRASEPRGGGSSWPGPQPGYRDRAICRYKRLQLSGGMRHRAQITTTTTPAQPTRGDRAPVHAKPAR